MPDCRMALRAREVLLTSMRQRVACQTTARYHPRSRIDNNLLSTHSFQRTKEGTLIIPSQKEHKYYIKFFSPVQVFFLKMAEGTRFELVEDFYIPERLATPCFKPCSANPP